MEVGYLCDAVDEWQRKRIRTLEENSVSYPDMAWKIEDTILPDCRQVYSSSTFMNSLFQTPLTSGQTKNTDGNPVYPLEEKHHVFNMIRVFCHTGLIVFSKGETIVHTLERYAAFHFYGIEEGKHVLKRLILDNLTPSNAIMAFEYAVHRDDEDLLSDIKTYICNYAFLVFRRRNFFSLRRESMADLVELCMSDKLNVLEVDLLSNLYRLCDKKVGDKEYPDFSRAFDLLTHKFNNQSLWDVVRLTSISMEEFMLFVQKHPGAMNNDDIVSVMKTIYDSKNADPNQPGSKKRKKFQTVSSYPRNLNFRAAQNPQGDVAHWERDKVQAFFVFDFGRNETVALPSIAYGDRHVRCTVTPTEKNIGLRGHVTSRNTSDSCGEPESVKFSASIVNFRHDRWKKTSVSVKLTNPCEFNIANILSCNAIEGSSGTSTGYVFDISKYPDYSEDGSWLMMSLSIESDSSA
ncbi:unnamed protein product [Pylaiella littoralis]